MNEKDELRWRYLKENLDQSRHHDTLRSSATNIIVLVSGAAFSIVGLDRCLNLFDVPILIFVFALGIFGAFFAAKQTERAALYYNRARALRQALDDGDAAPGLVALTQPADQEHDAKFSFSTNMYVRHFWILLLPFLSAFALVLIIGAFWSFGCAR